MEDVAYKRIFESELNHWWDKVKRKIVLDLMKKHNGSGSRPKILDLGCGTGAMAKDALSVGDYYGVDVSEKAVNFCKDRGIKNVKQGDALHIPYADNEFDVVLVLDAIEHVEDDLGALAEIRRVLKAGGIAVITAPAFMFLWGPTDEYFHHFRRYRLSELKSKMIQKDFHIAKASYFNIFLFLPIVLVRMIIKFLHLPTSLENDVSRKAVNDIWIVNKILYYIFYLESVMLKYINFPFGVSVVVVGRK